MIQLTATSNNESTNHDFNKDCSGPCDFIMKYDLHHYRRMIHINITVFHCAGPTSGCIRFKGLSFMVLGFARRTGARTRARARTRTRKLLGQRVRMR